ncbi:hypothetical protein PRZ48_010970 [Zasmidium cellare]|uniref:F-box domain-containing protein n=1 Tax=Zasmidium cellare TaxID=395010 RepID=A0ABR0EA59_ZASCE|nr:hypothetical protein PRZ48_010970 [Zasmidium cellare]
MDPMGLLGLLPGELRNRVYDLTLTHGPGHKASSALLRTCKQIHHEARSVLHYNSTFSFTANVDGPTLFAVGDVNGYHFGEQDLTHPSMLYVPRLRSLQEIFPPWTSQVRKWRIAIDVRSKPRSLSAILLYLASTLGREGCKVREARLDLRNLDRRTWARREVWERVLYPLAKIPSTVELTLWVEGFGMGLRVGFGVWRRELQALRFDPLEEMRLLAPVVRPLLDVHSSPLHIVAQSLWAIITAEFSSPHDKYLCRLVAYDRIADLTLRSYCQTLRVVLSLLRMAPSWETQMEYVEGSVVLRQLGFSRYMFGGETEVLQCYKKLCVVRGKMEVRGWRDADGFGLTR